jgi:phosphatidate cytidylyltransferase
MAWDRAGLALGAGVAGVLTVASVAGAILQRKAKTDAGRRTVANLNARTRAWWVMAGLFGLALLGGRPGVVILFALVSFFALREMVTLTPTRRADHRTLFWVFFVLTPLQYYLIYIGWYGLYSIFLPVYGALFIAIRSTLIGDYHNYLERTAKIQWALAICVYALSHAPALLTLHIPGYEGKQWRLLAFLVIVVQMSDVLQYVWGKSLGKRKIAPHISPNKTLEGFLGGVATATLLGAAMWKLTPFTFAQAAGLALLICLAGFFGGIVMSAVKRDAGVKDYGHLIEGHGGMMDRVDSLSFAAPMFFHVTRYFFAQA